MRSILLGKDSIFFWITKLTPFPQDVNKGWEFIATCLPSAL
jgi:hypothetical protein